MLQSYKDILSEKYNHTALQVLGEKNDFIFLFQYSFSFTACKKKKKKTKPFWKFPQVWIS